MYEVEEDGMGWPCSTNVEEERRVQAIHGKAEGMRPLGRPRSRWMTNIKMDIAERGWVIVDWIVVAKNDEKWRALVKAAMNLRVL
jgi:hypothetical protein